MPHFDYDFQRYVATRKGAREAARREGLGYAYAGDRRVRAATARLRPVTLALEVTARLWQTSARAELLATAVPATELRYARLLPLLRRAGERLHVQPPPVLISPAPRLRIATWGTDEDPQLLVHAALAEGASDEALLFLLGAELGRAQNGHVLLGTARHYLAERAPAYARWVVRPASAALEAWAVRAEITADRAGLLAGRDLDAARRAIVDEAASAEDGTIDRRAGARVAALELFAGSAYYRGVLGEAGGTSQEELDRRVARLLAGRDEAPPPAPPPAEAGPARGPEATR